MHAHDFREAAEFKGKRVCIVGGKYSAEDIAMQLLKYGAEHVIISFRSKPAGIEKIKKGLTQQPLLQKVEGSKLTFKNGVQEEVDAIILATGYVHSFPFLENDLVLKTKRINPLWTDDIWKGVVWEKNPRLFYLGMHDQIYSMPMLAAQAWFARDVILGKIKVPSMEEIITRLR